MLGFYFWCTNQFIVQRVLGARSLSDARRGALLAGLLKLPVLFIMVLPGVMAVLILPPTEPAPNSVWTPNMAQPETVDPWWKDYRTQAFVLLLLTGTLVWVFR